MVLHNPNNWHWVNKDVSPWAKNYLEQTLTGMSVEENGVTAKISKLVSMDGDVDVSQRKGKVITLFDVKLQLDFEGAWNFSLLRPSRFLCPTPLVFFFSPLVFVEIAFYFGLESKSFVFVFVFLSQ